MVIKIFNLLKVDFLCEKNFLQIVSFSYSGNRITTNKAQFCVVLLSKPTNSHLSSGSALHRQLFQVVFFTSSPRLPAQTSKRVVKNSRFKYMPVLV